MKYRFLGIGDEFLHGVPARDLTHEDWRNLSEAQRTAVKNSSLYVEAKGNKMEVKQNGG